MPSGLLAPHGFLVRKIQVARIPVADCSGFWRNWTTGAGTTKTTDGLRNSAIRIAALDFMAPAQATDVIGVGRVLRRGRSLTNCEAEILDPQGRLVAKALGTYKLG